MAKKSSTTTGKKTRKSGAMKHGANVLRHKKGSAKSAKESEATKSRKSESSRAARKAGQIIKSFSRASSSKRMKELKKTFKDLKLSPKSQKAWLKKLKLGSDTQSERVKQLGGWGKYKAQKKLKSSNRLKGIASRAKKAGGNKQVVKDLASALSKVGLSAKPGTQIRAPRSRRRGR
jgi:hypothetical protein